MRSASNWFTLLHGRPAEPHARSPEVRGPPNSRPSIPYFSTFSLPRLTSYEATVPASLLQPVHARLDQLLREDNGAIACRDVTAIVTALFAALVSYEQLPSLSDVNGHQPVPPFASDMLSHEPCEAEYAQDNTAIAEDAERPARRGGRA